MMGNGFDGKTTKRKKKTSTASSSSLFFSLSPFSRRLSDQGEARAHVYKGCRLFFERRNLDTLEKERTSAFSKRTE